MLPQESNNNNNNNDDDADALRNVLNKLQRCEDIGDDEAFRTRAAHLVERLDRTDGAAPENALLEECFELLKSTPVLKLQSDLRQDVLKSYTYIFGIVELPVIVQILMQFLKLVASGSSPFVHPVISAVVKQAIASAQEHGNEDSTMDECVKNLPLRGDFSWLSDVLLPIINSAQDHFASCEAPMPHEPLENASQP